MAEVIKMPRLSDTMTEGVVAKWHKKIGDTVKSGELLADIETDKATMEFESFSNGVLLHIGVQEGAKAAVDSILAVLGEKGEDVTSLLAANSQKEVISETKIEKQPVPENKEKNTSIPAILPTTQNNTPSSKIATSGKYKASPLARKLAAEKGLNISFVKGSGEAGRIVKRDIDSFSGGNASSFYASTESYVEEEVSQMRKTIAKRLSESKFSSPHFYLTMEVDMDGVIEARKIINETNHTKISFNDFVIKATAAALRQHPNVNSSWLGDKIRRNNHIHIGVAVAVTDGLLVPVIRFSDGKTLSQIAEEVKQLAEKAKQKLLQPKDWEGNTFTISNLGMYGIEEFTAIINPPDACILAVGGIKQKPVVKNGSVVPGNVMKVTLSCDHRVVDGATGSEFLNTFKRLIENPVLLLGSQNI
ncbi:pyruvate dehydrogenase E2 component (dihydrolipoamide acetyltransferase) [Flavobacteriales bacterium]|nr:Dihydrolipoyllysine-residue acetyltransferase component of pyruvate dehydrogenase complex [Flavobacteriales bacterium]MCL4816724.1 pyruvate dehydrogenase complex dihydrolipoamide acetyltransferase [Flavobacteriales bacterium]WKZ75897.1 MAG: pyruvate dehydrogenase complex dihydrolipoamide acetyltransferase [Vicingaceae bacterium]CAG0971227.1 pyruvate dehydrogenase E2 component (dihydrolipoamide acetyltransferase) [Flavobacteriales bacterium]